MKAISLFSGCGGCSLGLRNAGYDVRLAADIDPDACATYAANLDGGTIVKCVDLSEVRPAELLGAARLTPGDVDLVVGGPPCQGFSSAGARDWLDPRNALIRTFVEAVAFVQPTWLIMENVEGLLTAKEGFFLIEAITRFLQMGYTVRATKAYMERHGVPQRRKRVIVVGNLENCSFQFPTPRYHAGHFLPFGDAVPQLTILDAIGDLAHVACSSDQDEHAASVFYDGPAENAYQAGLRSPNGAAVLHHATKPVNAVTEERIRRLAPGQTMKHLPEELQHPSFARRAYRRVMDGTPTEKRGGAPSGLKRLVATEPSLTITSAAPTEFVHPTRDRLLTLRECARIQSFPDSFVFRGSWCSIATQIGNAIPPLFMAELACHIGAVATWRRHPRPVGRWLGIEATKAEVMSPALARMLADLQERTLRWTASMVIAPTSSRCV